MKISLFTQYGALNSVPIFDAFEAGAKKIGLNTVRNNLDAEILVIWSVLWAGRMKGNQEIWNLAKKEGKKLVIIEVGGLIRETTWRIGLEHINNLGKFSLNEPLDSNRPQKLGIFIKNTQNLGEKIIICGQHTKSEQWSTRPKPEQWVTTLVNNIRLYTDRKILFRPHPRDFEWCQFLPNLGIEVKIPKKISGTYDNFDLMEDFKNAYSVISPCSNPGIIAAIEGIPIFTDLDSLAYPVSNKKLENLQNPQLYDRTEWLIKLCHTEWTVEEISNGDPLRRLLKGLDI